MRRNWLMWGIAAAFLLLIVYAWTDGGRRPVREISQPVAVPEQRG